MVVELAARFKPGPAKKGQKKTAHTARILRQMQLTGN
jgi:hypothetical protein